MSALHAYQAAFTAHLRDPSQPKPRGTQPKRMAVYREIVFNNFFASVSSCFPVLHSILGKRKFKQLVRLCFHSQQFESPLFREIPQAFVSWLQTQSLEDPAVPAYSAQLAHYEWVELYVLNMQTAESTLPSQPLTEPLQQTLSLHPAVVLLAYDYPLHTLSRRHQQAIQEPTYLCVRRDDAYQLHFIALNAVSWQLLRLIESQPMTGEQALSQLAEQLQHPDPQQLLKFGAALLQQLVAQQVLV